MSPEWKDIALGLLTVISTVGGWFLKQLHEKTEHLDCTFIKEMIDAVFRKLDRIEDKLDQKADK